MLFIHDDQLQGLEGQEQRRARTDHDPRTAFIHLAPGAAALLVGKAGMPGHGRGAEALLEPFKDRLCQCDFREQDQHLGLRRAAQGGGNRFEIDLRLARAGHPVEQEGREAVSGNRARQGLGGGGLFSREVKAFPVRVGRGVRRIHGAFQGLQAASLDKALDDASRDPCPLGQLRPAQRLVRFNRGQHRLARRGHPRRWRPGQPVDRLCRRRMQRAARPQRHGQHIAGRVHRVFRGKVDEGAHVRRHGPGRQHRGDGLQLAPFAGRAHRPDHAGAFQLAERGGDIAARNHAQPLWHLIVEGLRQGQRK